MKKILSFLLFALCLTVAANAQPVTYDFEDGTIPAAFTNDETYPWAVFVLESETGNASSCCIKSGNAGMASSTSTIEITHIFEEDGYIAFDAKCMGWGINLYKCVFYIDDVEQFSFGGFKEGWNHYGYYVTSGAHTFRWEYNRGNYSYNPVGDAFFVDNIEIGTGELCETPASLKLSGTLSSVKVSWQSMALSFTLRYRLVGTTTWTTVPDITETSYLLTGLSAGNYELQVAASCDLENWADTTYDFPDLFSTANWYAFSEIIRNEEGFYLRIPDEEGNEIEINNHFINFSMLAPEVIGAAKSNKDTIRAACYADGYVWCIKNFYDYESNEIHWNLYKAPIDKTTHTIGVFETVVTDFEVFDMYYDISAMAYNPINRKIYYVVKNMYDWPLDYFFKSFSLEDPATVSAGISLSISPGALAFNPNGEAFCIDQGYTGKLYQLDLNDGSETLVGSLGIESGDGQGMAFDMETGELFWAQNTGLGSDVSGVYRVNPNTAEVDYIGQIGGGDYSQVIGMFKIWEGEFDACNVHYDLNVTPATTTAMVDWTEKGDATSWVVAYKAADGTDFTEITVNETAYTLTGLNPETDYIVKVRSVCEGESILWSSGSFTTHGLCDNPTNLIATPDATTAMLEWTGFQTEYNVRARKIIYQSDFESDESLVGWRSLDQDDDGDNWELSNYGHSGQHCYRSFSWHDDWTPDPDNWLISPTIDLNGFMSVWISSGSNTYFDHFAIYVTTNPEWSGVSDFTEVVSETVAPAEWIEYTVDLSAYAGQRGAIAIRHFNSYDQFWLFLDDFSVYETIPDITHAGNSVELAGLTPETLYQVQVQGICEGDATGTAPTTTAWTEPLEFTTEPEPSCVISEIEITGFTEPVYGATPDYDVEVPADANYTLGNVYWSENSIVMNTPVPFGANEYFMNIYIIPNEGCTFSDEVSVTINGNTEPVDPFSEVISDGSYHIYTIDYTLSAPSTCETPTNLSVSDITSNSATISWTGNVEEYEIEYGSGYYYYGFESGDLQDWTNLIVNTGEGEWLHSDDNPGSYDYTSLAHNGTGFAMCYSFIDYDGAYNTDAYLVSPQKYQINNGASLSFWYDMANDDYPEHFEVRVATVDNPTADDFTSIWNSQDDGSKYNAWREASIDLSAYAGQAIWIAFHDVNYDEYEIWIDDITVKTEAWTTVENATSPHTLNSLEAETPYFAHVRAICDDGVSVWSEPVEFTTTEEAEPCVINTIEITGFTEPVYGATPDEDVEVPADANYTLNRVEWKENNSYMFTTIFTANTYYMTIYITPNEGCSFSEDVTMTINGRTDLVDVDYGWVTENGDYEFFSIDYTLSAPSTCEAPTNLTATNITATSAKLGWTGNLEQYTVRYKDDAASDWTTATTANSTLALTGLTPATTYTAQVQGDCGSGAKSVTDWSDPVTFTTLSGTVEPGECGPAVDCDDISYPTVKIGDVCWMTKNLAAEACVTTGNVYSYVNDQFPDEDANVETYGLLYDEEAAFATGICPEGYTLPTTEQFEYLKNNFTVEELRNSTGWVVNTGTNGTGFSWDGSGFRNGMSETFEHLLMEGYLWAVDMTSGTPQPAMYKMMYYCNEIVRVYDFDGISASIRCVKDEEPQPEPEPEPEPEPFRCGTSNLKIGENSYETVQIGNQCWTKTNMREPVGEEIVSGNAEYPATEAYHFKVPSRDLAIYGYLYNWKAANQVCPEGWHLPTDAEWTQMENEVSTIPIDPDATGDRGDHLGKLAAYDENWDPSSTPNTPGYTEPFDDRNLSGFSARPMGYYWKGFDAQTRYAQFWTATENPEDTTKAYDRWMGYLYTSVQRYSHSKTFGYSVRCVRDSE